MLATILPPLKESPSSLTCNEHQGKSFLNINQACFPNRDNTPVHARR